MHWHAVLTFSKADEEQRVNDFGLPNYRSRVPCADCLSNRDDIPFTDLKAIAAWRPTETEMTFAQVGAGLRAERKHPLAGCVFLHRYFFADVMHMLDCKCCAKVMYGGIVGTLLTNMCLGENVAARMVLINALGVTLYSKPPGVLKLPLLRKDDFVGQGGCCVLLGKLLIATIMPRASCFVRHLTCTYIREAMN